MSNNHISHADFVPDNLKGLVADWSSDVQAFKVRWSKAMMWIFLVSDTFIFGSFLSAYMAVRLTTIEPWPNTSEVFALHVGGSDIPLLLIAIMTFILISSSGQSENMLIAAKKAKFMGISVVTLSGFESNNPLRKLGDINLWANSTVYNTVEMTHHIWLLAIVDYIIETNKE